MPTNAHSRMKSAFPTRCHAGVTRNCRNFVSLMKSPISVTSLVAPVGWFRRRFELGLLATTFACGFLPPAHAGVSISLTPNLPAIVGAPAQPSFGIYMLGDIQYDANGNAMVFLFDSSGTENAEAGSGMGVELLVDFGVGDVGKVLG